MVRLHAFPIRSIWTHQDPHSNLDRIYIDSLKIIKQWGSKNNISKHDQAICEERQLPFIKQPLFQSHTQKKFVMRSTQAIYGGRLILRVNHKRITSKKERWRLNAYLNSHASQKIDLKELKLHRSDQSAQICNLWLDYTHI